MHSKAASYNTLAQLPPNKFINNQDKVLLTKEERLEALQLLGCSSWKDIEPGNYANNDDSENLYWKLYSKECYVTKEIIT